MNQNFRKNFILEELQHIFSILMITLYISLLLLKTLLSQNLRVAHVTTNFFTDNALYRPLLIKTLRQGSKEAKFLLGFVLKTFDLG